MNGSVYSPSTAVFLNTATRGGIICGSRAMPKIIKNIPYSLQHRFVALHKVEGMLVYVLVPMMCTVVVLISKYNVCYDPMKGAPNRSA